MVNYPPKNRSWTGRPRKSNTTESVFQHRTESYNLWCNGWIPRGIFRVTPVNHSRRDFITNLSDQCVHGFFSGIRKLGIERIIKVSRLYWIRDMTVFQDAKSSEFEHLGRIQFWVLLQNLLPVIFDDETSDLFCRRFEIFFAEIHLYFSLKLRCNQIYLRIMSIKSRTQTGQ